MKQEYKKLNQFDLGMSIGIIVTFVILLILNLK